MIRIIAYINSSMLYLGTIKAATNCRNRLAVQYEPIGMKFIEFDTDISTYNIFTLKFHQRVYTILQISLHSITSIFVFAESIITLVPMHQHGSLCR